MRKVLREDSPKLFGKYIRLYADGDNFAHLDTRCGKWVIPFSSDIRWINLYEIEIESYDLLTIIGD